ncbi:LysR family transcriptional regulator [Rouxiella badensis]|jgi:DNA-binding transcriptional LysR family regulator|uniref:LysR family transcriptional regulator n=1 Tax=Rouxiella badensis TaxID=1646377 RepID=A0A1X0WIU9_9GAMM|nr:LysR family transcriptional regulator [Rouxiella badensis]MCC3701697.1 LysR family transcriptional regulator [Rouxiella badensis]MCC3720115.1 LysR family transcriptional regulator [Rouxiella badensis]MCC3729778.1 LysR family transcriptional regulator [Rouxiella badensis]MCC3731339.1 LysR family transcriptional regulator [Rouxiella badensis]MCC3738274.1 LysR family transcriptional regulator [Rouxiella badensis]
MNRHPSPKLNLEQLATFELVVRHGSFSAAAEQLGLTQPAVSLQVRQLEKYFNLKLLERIAKRMKPTSAGSTLLEHIAQLDNSVELALRAMAVHAQGVSGQVTLGTGATACIHLLPELLGQLKVDWPDLEVSVRIGNTDEITRAVEENRLDLGLVTLPAAGKNMSITPLYREQFVLIGPQRHDTDLSSLTPERLCGLPLVLFETGSSTRLLIDNWFQLQGLKPRPVMELGSIEAIKQMVSNGLGYSIVPQLALRGESAGCGLAQCPLQPTLERQLALVLRQDKPLNKGLKKLIDKLMSRPISKTDYVI